MEAIRYHSHDVNCIRTLYNLNKILYIKIQYINKEFIISSLSEFRPSIHQALHGLFRTFHLQGFRLVDLHSLTEFADLKALETYSLRPRRSLGRPDPRPIQALHCAVGAAPAPPMRLRDLSAAFPWHLGRWLHQSRHGTRGDRGFFMLESCATFS